ncbi:MAG: twin-arginine translocase TatA/TatE family subunit [Thermoleophilia bacterium]|nr:twin-arginine translocase TatA/TatE family subunit [Thermoleophilia bacterium]
MTPFGFLPQIGVPELLIVLAIAVLILGPKRIPAAAKSLGEGFRNFRGSLGGGDDDKADKPELGEKENKTEE